MSNSLRDQMLKTGLVDEKKAKTLEQSERQAHRKKKRKAKQQPKDERKAAVSEPPDSRKAAADALRARAEKDRELARARQIKEERRALKMQVRDIIERRRQARKDGEIAYNFVDDGKVKHIYVTAKLRDALGAGRMDIVRSGKTYEVVEAEVAEKLRALDPKVVIPRRDNRIAEEEAAYADHPIPDDLDW